MSVTGLCSVCESREATHVCEHCGGAVCETHYEPSASVCTNCSAAMDGSDGTGSDDGTGSENGPGPR